MFGREVSLPVDIMYKQPETDEDKDFTQELRERLHTTYDQVQQQGQTELRRQKRNYDKRSHGKLYEVGNYVWLRNNSRKKGLNPKLASKWTGPYKIITRLSDVTYRIQYSPRSKPSIVHFDRLKPCEGSEPYVWNRHKTDPLQPIPNAEEIPDGNTLPLEEPNSESTSDGIVDDGTNSLLNREDVEQGRRYPQRTRRRPDYFY